MLAILTDKQWGSYPQLPILWLWFHSESGSRAAAERERGRRFVDSPLEYQGQVTIALNLPRFTRTALQ
uniref:Uncharacterized protein n=1 Tax=Arundo donax TaxID=35708 RepID=A0A0A9GAS1_ARUDO